MPKLLINNCIDCPRHIVVNDPDPTDWFNDDDVAVLCTATPSDTRFKFRAVTSMCRPYRTRQESDVPEWCPLHNK